MDPRSLPSRETSNNTSSDIEKKFEFKVSENNLLSLNIIWFGPPSDKQTLYFQTKNSGAVVNHDIRNLPEICNNLRNNVFFWVSEQYEDKFTSRISSMALKRPVKIHIIEKFLRECKKNHPDPFIQTSANWILNLELILQPHYSSSVIHLVTIKDVFSLFLLATQGGYTLDTNVLPDPNKGQRSLPAFSSFCAASVYGQELNTWNNECWMMYSPASNQQAISKQIKR